MHVSSYNGSFGRAGLAIVTTHCGKQALYSALLLCVGEFFDLQLHAIVFTIQIHRECIFPTPQSDLEAGIETRGLG